MPLYGSIRFALELPSHHPDHNGFESTEQPKTPVEVDWAPKIWTRSPVKVYSTKHD